MRHILFLLFCFSFALYAKPTPLSLEYQTPISQIDGCKRFSWVRVRGQVVAVGYDYISLRDSTGVLRCDLRAVSNKKQIRRLDTLVVTGVVTRPIKFSTIKNFSSRSNPISTLKIQHVGKKGSTIYENTRHPDLEIPPDFDQGRLNRVILSEKKRYVRKSIIFNSMGTLVYVSPLIGMGIALHRDGENEYSNGGAIFVITLIATKCITTPISVPLFVAGIRNYRRAKRTPGLVPKGRLNYMEIELDLSLQIKPVYNGGGLFLVGNF